MHAIMSLEIDEIESFKKIIHRKKQFVIFILVNSHRLTEMNKGEWVGSDI